MRMGFNAADGDFRELTNCPRCGSEIIFNTKQDKLVVCPTCGLTATNPEAKETTKYKCKACDEMIPYGQLWCERCGKK